jgi:hypothetical protein
MDLPDNRPRRFLPILKRSHFVHGRKRSGGRVSALGVAILLFAGLSQFQPLSTRTVRADDRREPTPIAPALVTAIRDADAQAVRKLIDDGADVNARDAEGNTPLIPGLVPREPGMRRPAAREGRRCQRGEHIRRHGADPGRDGPREGPPAPGRRRGGPGADGRPRQHAADPGRPPRRQFPHRPIAARSLRRRHGAQHRRHQSHHRGRGERRSRDGAVTARRRRQGR